MHRITIITENPILKKLLLLMMAQLPESAEPVVLLDAAQLDRLDTFSGSRVIVFTASADPAYLAAAREAGVAGFCYLQPSLEELGKEFGEFDPKQLVREAEVSGAASYAVAQIAWENANHGEVRMAFVVLDVGFYTYTF